MHPVHPYRKAHPHSRLLVVEAAIFVAFVLFLLFILGFATNANPAAVLLAFSPSILFGLTLIALIETDHFEPKYNWFALAMFLVIIGAILFATPSAFVQGIDAGTVIVMNALLMAIALFVMHQSYVHEPVVLEHELAQARESAVHNTTVVRHVVSNSASAATEDIGAVLHSIEDKIKALNFVIGRVYSVYHGGTERLRNKIRIDKAWYEDFNQIDATDSERRRAEAVVLLSKIRDRLLLLKRTEREIFGDEASKLRNIVHDSTGGDPIIEILIRNDKDPVKQYYDGALTFCDEAVKRFGSALRSTGRDDHDERGGGSSGASSRVVSAHPSRPRAAEQSLPSSVRRRAPPPSRDTVKVTGVGNEYERF